MVYTLYIQGEYMSEPLTRFLDTAQENNVDDILLKAPKTQGVIHDLENFGGDLGEKVEKFFKHLPLKPAGPTPTYQESAFVKPQKETTLYNVTNTEQKLPVVTKVSNLFKDASYRVKGLTASAKYKNGCLYAGEKVGFGWDKTQSQVKQALKAQYNVGNSKTSIEYTRQNPEHTYSISVFNQTGNNGLTTSYSNKKGVHSALSIDEHSAALNVGYNKNLRQCNVDLSAYATSGDKYSNPFVGVSGRVTF